MSSNSSGIATFKNKIKNGVELQCHFLFMFFINKTKVFVFNLCPISFVFNN